MSVVGQAFVEVLPLAGGFAGSLQKQLQGQISTAKKQAEKDFDGLANVGKKAAVGIGVSVLAVAAYSLKAASNFDTLTTSLVTGAGESSKNLDMVKQGILQLAPAMGTSTTDLTNGLYMIESAGFHGAAGLAVLKAAAEGAKVGSADLATVANAVTTALTDYHLPASQATAVTSMLVETVASGKTHMQDLAGALSTVLPVAAAAKINLADVAGAIATMTGQGISAQQASQDLANTIRQLQNPSQQAISLMAQFGISSTTVSQQLGMRGLSGTLAVLVEQITKHMGPSGLILEGTFKQSQVAAADARTELAAMPASLRSLAAAYLNGSVTQTAWRKELKGLNVDQREMAQQFAATVSQTRGFSSALKAGTPEAKTLGATLAQLLGGATGLNTALALTGPNMATFTSNVANVYNAGIDGAKSVQGFALVQQDFGFKVDQAKQSVQVLAIQIGERLIPIVEKAADKVRDAAQWLAHHKDVALALAGVLGGVLAAAIGAYAIKLAVTTGKMVIEQGKLIAGFVKAAARFAAWVVETVSGFTVAEGEATVFGLTMESVGAASALALGGVLIAVAAVAVGAYFLITHWKQVREFFVHLWHDVAGFFVHLWHDVESDTSEAVDWIVRTWHRVTGAISGFFEHMWGDVLDAFHTAQRSVGDAVRAVVGTITGIFDTVRDWFEKWWPVLLPIVTALFLGPLGLLVGVVVDEIILHWHRLVSITETVFRALGWFFAEVWHLWSELVNTVVGAIVTAVTWAWGIVDSITRAVYGALRPYLAEFWSLIVDLFRFQLDVIETVLGAAWGIISGAVHIAWDAITAYFTAWWAVLTAIFNVTLAVVEGILRQAWIDIRAAIELAWDAIRAYFQIWWTVLSSIVKIGWDLISGLFNLALDLIEGKWSAAWHTIESTFSAIWNTIKGAASSIWGDISGFFTGALHTFEGWWGSTWQNVANTFSNIWNGIAGGVSGVWSGIVGGIQAGIRDVENIINSAFINPINAVLGVFGVHIGTFNTSSGGGGHGGGAIAPTAGGGGHRMESGGMIVNHPTVLVGEGRKGYPEAVIPTDPAYHGRARMLLGWTARALGVGLHDPHMPALAGGAWWDPTTYLSAAGNVVAGAAGDVAGGISGALHWVDSHTVGPVVDAAAGAAEGLLGEIRPAIIGRATAGIIKQVAAGIKRMLGAGGGSGKLGGSIPTGDHLRLIAQALQLAGQPADAANEAAVNLIVSHESGWNPNAINNWDSNAKAGDPSRGLMQTIGSTFEAYRLAGLPDNIYDPLANLVAGIRYAVADFGSLSNVPGVRAVSGGGHYVGYDSGGWLMPGFTPVWNGTGVPERVISPSGAGPAGGGVTIMPGAVNVQVELSGDASSGPGVAVLVRQGVEQGITDALNEIMDMMGGRNPARTTRA